MSQSDEVSSSVDRRRLLRGGALLLGAAGVAAVSTSAPAEAATGDPVKLGQRNTEGAATTIMVTAGDAPALSLVNTNGPQMRLGVVDDNWQEPVELGDIVNTDQGPLVGIDFGPPVGVDSTPLLTARDIPGVVPLINAVGPERVLDTRTAKGRAAIVGMSSPDALTSAGKLRGGHWIDLGIDPSNKGYLIPGWFFNVTVVQPAANGWMSVYSGINRELPSTSTINFQRGVDTANGGFVGGANQDKYFTARLYTTQDTHLLWDTTGMFLVYDDEFSDARATALRKIRNESAVALRHARETAHKDR